MFVLTKHITMRIFLISALLLSVSTMLSAQSHVENYDADIWKHRRAYKEEFLDHPRSPLGKNDTAFVDFFAPDHSWNLNAKVELTPNAPVFDLPTYSGQLRKYRQYALLQLEHKGQAFQLSMYQNITLMSDSAYTDYLFLPFTDLTNGETTYEGGRYLDFKIGDIHDGKITIDFNKCYNPYCAYSDGYNCPVPPAENRLKMKISVGEKKFKKEKKH
jgi:uncharacterized protein (DUF1684 family)